MPELHLLEQAERNCLRMGGFPSGTFHRRRAPRNSSSLTPVQTPCPFLATIVAVPVSWHMGKTNPAATAALRKKRQRDGLLIGRGFRVVENRGDLR